MTELDIIRIIQSIHNPFLDNFFQLITMLGESFTIMIIVLGIYWCIDKTSGEYIGYSFFTSGMLNNSIKNIVKAKRPIGEEGIRSLRVQTATGYSFPSGHTQGAASTYGALYLLLKKSRYAFVFMIIIFLVGLSRLYLGVHYPKDVLGGMIFGGLTSYVTYRLFKKSTHRTKLYLITLIIFLPFVLNSSVDFARSMGGFIGFIAGISFEQKFVKFKVNVSIAKKILRFTVGVVILFTINVLFYQLSLESIYLKFIKESLISFIGFGAYPYLFKK